ncbi:MAG: S46 family peptidase [Bacteroidales bacterium]
MNLKKVAIAFVLSISLTNSYLKADEGLWFPALMKKQNYKEMKSKGLQLKADQIYSDKKADLTEAVMALTSAGQDLKAYASASFISPEGLVITNHHAVFDFIERFSSEKNDFMKFGYWAKDRTQESQCFGLQVTLLFHQKDVTKDLTKGLEGITDDRARMEKINERSKAICAQMDKEYPGSVSQISSYMAGNGYILNSYYVYKDVRMVAAPPMQIGRYAGQDDNWQWPRHTGDFAILRVYADKDNKPAAYSKDNVPYRPAKYLPISKQGVRENDFAMIFGYPSTTREYIPSFALDKIVNEQNAARVKIRESKLNLLQQAIGDNPILRLRYTGRMHSIENSYLRWKGEIAGVKEMDLVNIKVQEEAAFQKWIDSDSKRKAEYGDILDQLRKNYDELAKYNYADVYFQEAGLQGAEIVPIAGKFEKLMAMFERKRLNKKAAEAESKKLLGLTNQYYFNWDYELDRKMFRDMVQVYMQDMPMKFYSVEMVRAAKEFNGDMEAYSKYAFENSILTNKDSIQSFLKNVMDKGVDRLKNDPVYQMAIGYYRVNVNHIAMPRKKLQDEQMGIYSKYLKAYMEWKKNDLVYPDANRTMRYSFGRVKPVADFKAQTFLSELVKKADAHGDSASYYLPRKLRALYEAKDYKDYAQDGDIPVNFITDCHTTSGSSGSAVINAKGEFIGINFDRFVDGVASDYRYMPSKARSITVDSRYILFILDQYSPSKYVLEELDIR